MFPGTRPRPGRGDPEFLGGFIDNVTLKAFEPRRFIALGDDVVVDVHLAYTVKRTGKLVDLEQLHWWSLADARDASPAFRGHRAGDVGLEREPWLIPFPGRPGRCGGAGCRRRRSSSGDGCASARFAGRARAAVCGAAGARAAAAARRRRHAALISYVGRDRRYRFVNKLYGTWFRCSGEEVIGKTSTKSSGPETMKLAGAIHRSRSAGRRGPLRAARLRTPADRAGWTPSTSPTSTPRARWRGSACWSSTSPSESWPRTRFARARRAVGHPRPPLGGRRARRLRGAADPEQLDDAELRSRADALARSGAERSLAGRR